MSGPLAADITERNRQMSRFQRIRSGVSWLAAVARAAVWVLGTPAPWEVAGAVALELSR